MSVRARAIIVGAVFLVLIVAWFFLLFRPNQSEIDDLREEQDRTQQEIEQLEARLLRLEELRDREPQLRADFARMEDALPSEPRLPDFILQVQEAANLAGIEFLSISPSLPGSFSPPVGAGEPPGPGELQAMSVSVSTTGTYFALEDFIIRMERLQRAVRINSFSLAPTGDAPAPGVSPTLSVSFSMQMFVIAPDGAPPPGTIPPPEEPIDEDTEPAPDDAEGIDDVDAGEDGDAGEPDDVEPGE